jgi:hypothetical protein
MGLRKDKSLIDQAGEYVDQVKPQLEAAVATAKEKAGPVIADARSKAAPVIADAKAKAGPAIATGAAAAAEKVAEAANVAADKAAEAAEKVAEAAEPEPEKKKGSKFKKLLILTGIAAAAAFIASKLRARNQSDNWQSSYTPTPAPAPATETPDDEGGASPDEALADQAEAPHEVTTPDEPADVVDVEKKDS